MDELSQEFAVPVEMLKLYNTTDIERENDIRISENDRDQKLIDICGLQEDGQYELDLELPAAISTLQTKIKIVSGKCSIIAYKEQVFELDNPESDYMIALKKTSFVSRPDKSILLFHPSCTSKCFITLITPDALSA